MGSTPMTIDAVELFHVAAPTSAPAGPNGSGGRAETVLVRLTSGGLEGWGEASPPAVPGPESEEWAGGAFALLQRWLAPCIVGEDISSSEEVEERLARFRGNSFAKAALDCAWWDLDARRQGTTLAERLGGARRTLHCGVTLGERPSIDDLLKVARRAFAAGAAHVTLKLRPGWHLEPIRAMRETFPLEGMRVDFDGAASLEQRDLFFRLDDFSLAAVEQPLDPDDLVGHAVLQESLRTPLCLDQSITSRFRAAQAIELGACRELNLQPDRCGGLTPALAIRALARSAGVPVRVGVGPRTGVGAAAAVALACADGFDGTIELAPVGEEFGHHAAGAWRTAGLWPKWLAADGSGMLVPYQSPGIGFAPEVDVVRRLSVASARLARGEKHAIME